MPDLLYIYHSDPSSWEPFGVKQILTLAGALVGMIVIWLSHTSVEISPDNRRYRTCYHVLGMHLGKWQPLPPVVGVTLKYYSVQGKAPDAPATSWGIWNNTPPRHEKLIVMLSLRHSATGLILTYFDLDDVNTAIDFAHDTAERFQVPVHQYLPPHLFEPLPPVAGSIGPNEKI